MPEMSKLNFGIPPWGVRCTQTENGWIVSATTRSCAAPFPIAFMSLMTYFMASMVLSPNFSLKGFTLAPALIGIGMILFMLLFWWVALMGVLGKVEVRLDGDDGRVFTGFGPFGWSRRFKRSEVRAVGEIGGREQPDILIEGRKRIRFGSWLSNSRRQFMVEVLSRLLLP